MTPTPPPPPDAPPPALHAWSNEVDQYLQGIGFPGHPADITVQLAVRGLGLALGLSDEALDQGFARARRDYLEAILPLAEQAAARARLLGGLHIPPQNGSPK
jgi:hypothetical protein